MTSPASIANLLVARLGIDGPPSLSDVCHRLGLRIKEVPSSAFDGVLIRDRIASKGIIGIRGSIRELSRKRFTIAHEIGHFVMPGHKHLPNACESARIDSYGPRVPAAEREANQFAAELLLPSKLVGDAFRACEPSLESISSIAKQFLTSFSATARRMVEMRDDGCAVIWQEKGNIIWVHRNRNRFPFFLAPDALPVKDPSCDDVSSIRNIAHELRRVDPACWLSERDAESVGDLFEESRYFPNYNAVISLLWIPDSGPTICDEDELIDELDPSSFTIQRARWPR